MRPGSVVVVSASRDLQSAGGNARTRPSPLRGLPALGRGRAHAVTTACPATGRASARSRPRSSDSGASRCSAGVRPGPCWGRGCAASRRTGSLGRASVIRTRISAPGVCHPRQQPDAVVSHVRICGGVAQQWVSLLRPSRASILLESVAVIGGHCKGLLSSSCACLDAVTHANRGAMPGLVQRCLS
jgi:hypothetical protein